MAEDGGSNILEIPASTPEWPPKAWTPRALPDTPNIDGRPIWEPPFLNYSHLIDDAYHEKRKEALRYTKGDVVKTTEILDVLAEFDLLTMFDEWLGENVRETWNEENGETVEFWQSLRNEVGIDHLAVLEEKEKLNIYQFRRPDETWKIGKRQRIPVPVDTTKGARIPDLGNNSVATTTNTNTTTNTGDVRGSISPLAPTASISALMDVEAPSLEVAKLKRVVSEQEETISDLQSQLQLTTDMLRTHHTRSAEFIARPLRKRQRRGSF